MFHEVPRKETIFSRYISDALSVTAKKKSRIANMLSGRFRNFRVRKQFCKDLVRSFPSVDILIHTWSESGHRYIK